MWEAEVLRFLEGLRNGVLTPLFKGITVLGEETVLVVLLAVLYFAVNKALARRMFFVTMLSMSVNGIVKNIVQRPRPFAAGVVSGERLETASGFSFPSGHVQCLSSWTTVAALHLRRVWVWIVTAAVIAAVAVSRLFLGAHYPTDVLCGAVLGVGLSLLFNVLYDRVQHKERLYWLTALALTPFAVWFMIAGHPLFNDFFKFYGMMIGFAAAVSLEERVAPLDLTVAWWKKLLRVVTAIALVLLIRTAFKWIPVDGVLALSFLMDTLRSVAMIFVALGVCPWLFKRLHL